MLIYSHEHTFVSGIENPLKGIQDLGIEIVRINARNDLHPYEEKQTTK